jgi:NADH-quinone oxidoreductase subunit J
MQNFVVALIFVITVGSACLVAFSRNLIYSAFALIGTFLGVAASFILLSADFIGLTQVMVYAGGILVLTIFAVMLTSKIESAQETNPLFNWKAVVVLMVMLMGPLLYLIFNTTKWKMVGTVTHESRIVDLGEVLLGKYLLPFELISILLLMSMIGAAIISRRQVKGVEE